MSKRAKKAAYRASIARMAPTTFSTKERLKILARARKYSDAESRDDHGRWTSDGGGDGAARVANLTHAQIDAGVSEAVAHGHPSWSHAVAHGPCTKPSIFDGPKPPDVKPSTTSTRPWRPDPLDTTLSPDEAMRENLREAEDSRSRGGAYGQFVPSGSPFPRWMKRRKVAKAGR